MQEFENNFQEFQNSMIQKFSNKISEKIDEIILEGLKLKGFEFEHKIELIDFIKTNCNCIILEGEEESKYFFVNNDPFLILQFNNDLSNLTFDEKLNFSYDLKYNFI